jgi:hypothetical protein
MIAAKLAKVTVRDPSSHNRGFIAKGNILLILTTEIKTLCIFIDSADFPQNYGRISLFLQKATDRETLFEQERARLSPLDRAEAEVVIRAINDKDFRVRVPHRFCGRKPCKPAPTITILFMCASLNGSRCTLLELPFD